MRQLDRVLSVESRWPRAWMLALMSLWFVGCGSKQVDPAKTGKNAHSGPPGETSSATPLRIAAASDLQSALPRLLDRFQARTGTTSTPVFLSSGQLAEQIKQGAPFDVFMAANESFVRDLADGGFVRPESVHPYARGSLVLAVYHELGDTVRTLTDLNKPEVKKIALANPVTAPYGKAGKEALERAGLWEKLKPKIVQAESVRQALLYAQKGDAEAALVGRAIATVPGIRAVEVDPRLYDPIVQALGIVKAASRMNDAEAFARFVLGDEGQAILKEFGFKPAGVPTDNSRRDPGRRENEAQTID